MKKGAGNKAYRSHPGGEREHQTGHQWEGRDLKRHQVKSRQSRGVKDGITCEEGGNLVQKKAKRPDPSKEVSPGREKQDRKTSPPYLAERTSKQNSKV